MQKTVSLIVVGSSGNGKTTLVNGLRPYDSQFTFPKRYITRPQRKGDDLIENKHVRPEKFDALLEAREVDIAWHRPLGKTRVERYGFEPVGKDGDKIVVYSGNNALLRDENAILPANLLKDSLVILVKAPDAVRRERMFARSPDISREEMAVRIADNGLDLVPKADLVIDTDTLGPQQVIKLVLAFIGSGSQS
jgi:ribose 1,5-bisphosphokinase PhnN